MNARRLIDTSTMTPRPARRADLVGEVLPPAELVPWEEAEVMAQRQPAPIISITLPRARADDVDGDAPLMEYERRRAQRQPSVESDVVVPGMQTAITALAVGMAAGVGCLLWGWPVRFVLVAFCIGVLIAWLWRLRLVDSLLWEVERITGRDVNGDRRIGQPATMALVNPAQARAEVRRDVDATEQAAQHAELLAFVHRCYTVGCSEGAHGVKASGPDRQSYVRQRDVLLSLGVAAWKNPQRPKAGWKMAVSYARAQELIARHVL